ncbi:acetate--CoA ligase family protein [Scopulibacillus cellulosilyticus]|uniref:Acetate--CoA ligase family protein n=1 Tax=Scopulibacillus cellulosilyticus TaxID=2665665 RepID=A0ABW2PU35_9BACL
MPLAPERLREFFCPDSIALIGATDRSRWSLNTFMNLKNSGFNGPVYCIHPYKDVVHGEKAFRSVLEIGKRVDLAFVMVPKDQILKVLKEACQVNIRNFVILTSGFSETGEKGGELEKKIYEFANKHDQVILGPNGNGFIHVSKQITPYGLPLPHSLLSGPVGIVLQSGALASSLVTLSEARHVGLSLLVSMGNETMMSTTDVIEYLIEDDATRVIALFLESIRNPDEFRRLAHKALSCGKPIIALKIGRSEESARTAMAHTGSLVGDDTVNDSAFRQLGVIRVHSLEDLITTAGILGYIDHLPGKRMGVVTPSGGACDIISDRAKDEGIELPAFSSETVNKLEKIVPDFSTVHNPLDVTGYVVVDRTLMLRALEVASGDPGFDFILCLLDVPRIKPDNPLPIYEQFRQAGEISAKSKIPIAFVTNACVDIVSFGKEVVNQAKVHFIGGIEHGMKGLGKALWWYEKRKNYLESQRASVTLPFVNHSYFKENSSLVTWSENEARHFLAENDIPVVPGILCSSIDKAVAAARQIGFPVAMKIQSSNIAHKSDIGGVSLDLKSDSEVEAAYVTMVEKIMKKGDNRLEGVLISPMRKKGIELLVGILKDPLWGPVLAVGFGGVFVEVLKDTSLRILPVERSEIREMLRELRGADLLEGVRGQPPVNIEKIVDVIYQLTKIATDNSEYLQELEVNPLWADNSNVEALDAMVVWRQPAKIF